MNTLKKNVLAGILFIGIGVLYVVSAYDANVQLKTVEARTDAKLEKMGLFPVASSSASSAVPGLEDKALIINKPVQGDNCVFYAFKYDSELEKNLKQVAELHWLINDKMEVFDKLKSNAETEKNSGNYTKAKNLLEQAENILKTLTTQRDVVNKLFKELIAKGEALFTEKNIYSVTQFTEVENKISAFMLETAEKGKYVRAWAFSAKGGMELTISGREVTVNRKQ